MVVRKNYLKKNRSTNVGCSDIEFKINYSGNGIPSSRRKCEESPDWKYIGTHQKKYFSIETSINDLMDSLRHYLSITRVKPKSDFAPYLCDDGIALYERVTPISRDDVRSATPT